MYDLHKLIDAISIIQSAQRELSDSLADHYRKQALDEAIRLLNEEIDRDRQEFNEFHRAESMGSRYE